MNRWLAEPLLHFLLAGGLLFAGYFWLHDGDAKPQRVVRITAADVEWLKQTWGAQRLRPPSEDELKGLVASYLTEELLAREARELGLDENDTIVRRRLSQKMEFLVTDTSRLAEPAEDELRRYYAAEPSRYLAPARVSFEQIFFATEAAARQGLDELATHPADELGDATMLEREIALADPQTVTSVFGPRFSDRLFELETGRWLGPVASGYGFHLVRISRRIGAEPRPFDEVRESVLDTWHRERQAAAHQRLVAGLLNKYDVVVDESVRPLIGSLEEALR